MAGKHTFVVPNEHQAWVRRPCCCTSPSRSRSSASSSRCAPSG